MITMKKLEKLPYFSELAAQPANTFFAFDKAALAEGAIPRKYKELMAVAVALTTQCAYCIELHREAAVKAGVTEQEFGEAVFVTAALRAGAAVTHGTHLLANGRAQERISPIPGAQGQDLYETSEANPSH